MGKYLVKLLAALLLLCVTGPVGAITLEECIEDVLSSNPKALEKLKSYNAAVHDREAIRSAQNFSVYVHGDVGHQEVSNSSTRYKHENHDVTGARIVARKLLSDGNRLKQDIAAREANARSALFAYVDVANTLAYETAEAYVAVLKTRELLQLALENVEIHTRLTRSIRARVEAKTSGKSELERVQGRLAAAQASLIVRQNDYKRTIYQLHKVMGRFIDGKELEMPKISGTLLPTSLSAALKKQWDNHPMLIAADFNISAKEHELKREQRENRPDLFFEAYRDWRKNFSGIRGEDNDTAALLRLSFPLFDGHQSKHRARQYKSLVHREKHQRDYTARTVLNDLQLTYSGYKLLDSQIGALKKSIFFTRQALRSYQQEFKLGKRLLINILDAEVEYQNARSQLALLRADLLTSKYRLLLSMGAIVEDLGLEVPLARQLADAKRARPASQDEMPFDTDFDKDGIDDKIDVSMNSLQEQVVNEFGETVEMTLAYLEEPVKEHQSEEFRAVKDKADLQLQSIHPDVPTELGFVTFIDGSEELSQPAKVLMREILPQLKRLADDGQVKISVTEGAVGKQANAHLLALQRAYNLKKILTMHLFDPEGISVEARPVQEGEQPNAMILTVLTSHENFNEPIEIVTSHKLRFPAKESQVNEDLATELQPMAARLKNRASSRVDLVAYANDLGTASANKAMSLTRAEAVKEALAKMGVTNEINCIGWGNFDEAVDLYSAMEDVDSSNMLEFVIRD